LRFLDAGKQKSRVPLCRRPKRDEEIGCGMNCRLWGDLSAHNYKPRLLGGMLVAVGGRAKEGMEEKDLVAI